MEPNDPTTNSDKRAQYDIQQHLIQESIAHKNTKQEFIITKKDKIKLVLIEHLKNTADKRFWITPLGFLFTLILIPLTTTFKDTKYASAIILEAMCNWGIILVSLWLLRSIYNAVKSKQMTIDDIIEILKKEEQQSAIHKNSHFVIHMQCIWSSY